MGSLFKISLIDLVEVVFSLSLFFNAALFVPQALRIMCTKSAEGVSLFTFIGFHIIQVFTILHAYFAKDYILMTGFLLSFLTCSMVTYLALKYRNV
jgi:MtN3 and saliva related transmembrane protein